ncbi:MAG TPA: hypothetical protein VFU30_07485 [Gaiellaceae bacterium]|nr:hypothetical protein [Gaiellaceae bacterium]
MSFLTNLRAWWKERQQRKRQEFAEKSLGTTKAVLDDSDRHPPMTR